MTKIIITGAGFTHQFGAPVLSDLWELVFNNPKVQTSNKLKSILFNNKSDFETAYQEAISQGSTDERKCFLDATISAYDVIDQSCCKIPNNMRDVNKLFIEFINRNQIQKSIIFTLNQDLFIERQLNEIFDLDQEYGYKLKLSQLGIEREKAIFLKRLGLPNDNIKKHYQPFQNDWRLHYDDAWLATAKDEFSGWQKTANICPYIKLHGSQDLFTNESQPVIVIGRQKVGALKGYPILDYYYNEVFSKTLSGNKCKILIIGYGFADEHINSVIRNSTNGKDSELHIVTRDPLEDLLNKIEHIGIKKSNIFGIYTDGFSQLNINLILNNFVRSI